MSTPCTVILTALILSACLAPRASGAGQALGIDHPAVDWGVSKPRAADYEAAVARVMSMPEEELLQFVPPWTYVQYCECPNCYGGVEGNSIFTWTIERPDEMTCRFCKTVFPSKQYPETESLTGQNALGETISLPYHKGAETGAPHFLSTHLLKPRRSWLVQQADALARAYAACGKEEYARKVAVILDAFAQRYPHYPVMQNLPRRITFREQKAPWPWDSGRWDFFHNNIPISLLPAYDLTYLSPAFDQLSNLRGYDVREKIERDFLKPAAEEIMVRSDHINNCVGYDVRSAAILGRVIHEPRYVHWAFGWMVRNLTEGFMRDGFWKEGTHSYHDMTVGGLTYAFDAVKGYSDPAGYLDPVDATRYDNLDPDQAFPFWGFCKGAPDILATPDGIAAVFHDTHPYEHRATPRQETISTLMPAVGHASLGRGRGANQMQAQLHFSGNYGHQHHDHLNFMLWAKGREMLPDLGYTWTQMRTWTTSSVAHNMVVIDRTNTGGAPADGRLLAFHPGDTSDPESLEPSLVEADGSPGYARIAGVDLYQRTLIMVPVSPDDAYVVDLFRVRGGQMHDWALHGDADHETTVSCDLHLGPASANMLLPGETWVEPQQEHHTYPPYGMLRDMRPAPVSAAFSLDFNYPVDEARGYRLHMLPCGDAELWLGRAPSVRRMGQGTGGDMRKAYDFWMPALLLRRAGDGPLTSVFPAVHEPWSDSPFIDAVRPVAWSPAGEFALALEVRCGQIVDTILSTNDLPPYPERQTESGIRFRGRFAVVRQVQGETRGMWMFDAESLVGEDFAVQAETPAFEGDLSGATRTADGEPENALITSAELPAGDALKGRWLLVTYPTGLTQGHELERVIRRDGQTLIVTRQDHGLRISDGGIQEQYAPHRKLEGVCRFRLAGSVSVTPPAGD